MRGEPVHSTLMTRHGGHYAHRQGKELILPIGAQALVPSLDSSWGVGEVSTQFWVAVASSVSPHF